MSAVGNVCNLLLVRFRLTCQKEIRTSGIVNLLLIRAIRMDSTDDKKMQMASDSILFIPYQTKRIYCACV